MLQATINLITAHMYYYVLPLSSSSDSSTVLLDLAPFPIPDSSSEALSSAKLSDRFLPLELK